MLRLFLGYFSEILFVEEYTICASSYIIRYQSRDAIYPVLKGSGFVKR